MAKNEWTTLELKKLQEIYPTAGKAELIAAFPNHTWNSIQKTALRKLNVRKHHRNTWTQEELQILIQNSPSLSQTKVAKLLPNHTLGSVIIKQKELRHAGLLAANGALRSPAAPAANSAHETR